MLVTVYDPEGNAVEVEPVDAREYIEHCGYTKEAPVNEFPEPPEPPEEVEETEPLPTTRKR